MDMPKTITIFKNDDEFYNGTVSKFEHLCLFKLCLNYSM